MGEKRRYHQPTLCLAQLTSSWYTKYIARIFLPTPANSILLDSDGGRSKNLGGTKFLVF